MQDAPKAVSQPENQNPQGVVQDAPKAVSQPEKVLDFGLPELKQGEVYVEHETMKNPKGAALIMVIKENILSHFEGAGYRKINLPKSLPIEALKK